MSSLTGAQVEVCDTTAMLTPLCVAAKTGSWEIASALIEAGAKCVNHHFIACTLVATSHGQTRTHAHAHDTTQGELHYQVWFVSALHHVRAGPLRYVRASAQERYGCTCTACLRREHALSLT
jgi:hypothetical protein